MAELSRDELLEHYITHGAEKHKILIKADWRYPWIFRYLQISPSYHLVHTLETTNNFRPEWVGHLPRDLKQVGEIYRVFGDVWSKDFGTWWLGVAQYQFAATSQPAVYEVARLESGCNPDSAMFEKARRSLEQYMFVNRVAEAKPAAVALFIPLLTDRRETKKLVDKAISNAYSAQLTTSGEPIFALRKNKVRVKTVADAYELLVKRVAFPDKKLWMLGNDLNVSPVHATLEKDTSPAASDHRKLMATMTSQRLNRALMFAENAARGRFLTDEPVQFALPFDLPGLRKWMVLYKAEMLVRASYVQTELNQRAGSRSEFYFGNG